MAGSVKISQLIEAPAVGPNDSIPIARGGQETFRTPAAQFVTQAVNIGVGPGQLFSLKTASTPTTLQFRTLSATGENLAIETVGDTVVFSTSGQNPIKTTFVADGSATTWPLPEFNSNNAANYRVDFDGVLQEPFTDYNLSASHIVFTTAPLLSTKIVVVSNNSVRVNEAQPAPNTLITNMYVDQSITPEKLSIGAPSWDIFGTTTISTLSVTDTSIFNSTTANNFYNLFPAFYVTKDVGSTPSDTTDLIWNIVYVNEGNCYNVDNGQFTAPVKGIYNFYATLLPANAAAGDCRLGLWVNNIHFGSELFTKGASQWQQLRITRLIQLNAGDIVTTRYWNAGGTHHSDTLYNQYNGFLIKQLN